MTRLVATTGICLLALSGVAMAQCAGWEHKTDQTAENYTPIPNQDEAEVAENPLLLILPEDGTENAEG